MMSLVRFTPHISGMLKRERVRKHFDAETDLIFHQTILIVRFLWDKHAIVTFQVVKHDNDNDKSFKSVFIDSQLI